MDGNGKETKQDNGLEIEQKNRQEKKTVPGKPEEIIPSGKQEGKPALKKREGKPALADAGSSGEKKEGRKKSGKGGGNDSKKKKSGAGWVCRGAEGKNKEQGEGIPKAQSGKAGWKRIS